MIFCMIFTLQFLERYPEDIWKPAIHLFVHMGINAKMGMLCAQFSEGAKQPVPYT